MFDNKWQRKEMPLVSLIGMSGGIASPAFLSSILIEILKPTILSPANNTGLPDVSYPSRSSAITSIDTVPYGERGATANIANNSLYSTVYGDGKWVTVGGGAWYSTDGVNWSRSDLSAIPNESGSYWSSVTYGNGKFVAVATQGSNTGNWTATNKVMYSTDGINWTATSAVEAISWVSVAYGNGMFIAVANHDTSSSVTGIHRVMTSTDGITWTGAGTGHEFRAKWNDIAYGDGKFVAVADIFHSSLGGTPVISSTDGVTWTGVEPADYGRWESVAYGNGMWVAVGNGNFSVTHQAMYSTDAINWTSTVIPGHLGYAANRSDETFEGIPGQLAGRVSYTNPDKPDWRAVSYGGGKFVAFAEDSYVSVAYSYDGINWNQSFTNVRPSHQGTPPLGIKLGNFQDVQYGDNKWLAVGKSVHGAPTYCSPDGINWLLEATVLTLADDTVTDTSTGNVVSGATIEQVFKKGEIIESALGEVYWSLAIDNNGRDDSAQGIAIDNSGSTEIVYYVGTSKPFNGSENIFIAKYDTDGNHYWNRMFGHSGINYGHDIAISSTGDLFIAGTSYFRSSGSSGGDAPNAGQYDPQIAKFDADGNVIWQRCLGRAYDDFGASVAVDDSGYSYLTGYVAGGSGGSSGNDIVTAKYDPSGNLVWQKTLYGPLGGSGVAYDQDYGDGILVDGSGNIYVAGRSGNTSATTSGVFIKYDTNGNVLWQKRCGGTYSYSGAGSFNAGFRGICFDPSGNIGAVGTSPDDYLLIVKYDTNGNALWERQIGNSTTAYGYGITSDSLGNFYAVCRVGTGNSANSYLVSYDADGNYRWQIKVYRYGFQTLNHVACDSNDNVYAAGQIKMGSSSQDNDAIIVKLPSDGSKTGTFDGVEITASTDLVQQSSSLTHENSSLLITSGTCTDSVSNCIAYESADCDNMLTRMDTPAAGEVISASGNTITLRMLDDSAAPWSIGMTFENQENTDYPDALIPYSDTATIFTSSQPAAAEEVSSWGAAIWEIATDSAFTQNVQSATVLLTPTGTQAGPTGLTLEPMTGYYVRTRYSGMGSRSPWSDATYFETTVATTLDILAPKILSPVHNSGSGLAGYTAESSAITSMVSGASISGRVDVGYRNLYGIDFGGGKFVAVADAAQGETSSPVIHFDDPTGTIGYSSSAENGNYWRDVAYGVPSTGAYQGQGMFVATSEIGGTNRIMYSVDGGANWSGASPAVHPGSWYGVGYGDGKFVAVGRDSTNNNPVLHSTDGITWTPASDLGTTADPNAATQWQGVAYGNGKWVAVAAYGGSSRIMYSTDADTWTTITDAEVSWDGSTHGWSNVIYGGDKFVAITEESRSGIQPVIVSTDGITWQQSNVTPYDNLRRWSDIAYGEGLYVAIAGSNTASQNAIFYSTDAITWEKADTPGTAQWNGIAYGNGKWVAVCSSGSYITGRMAWSEDGITWTGTVTDFTLTDNTSYRDGALLASSFTDFLSAGKKVYFGQPKSNWVHRLLQPSYSGAWTRAYDQVNRTVLPVATDSSGNFYHVGPTDKAGTPAVITKYDGSFNRLWQKTFHSNSGSTVSFPTGQGMGDAFTAAVCDSSDNVYVVGDISPRAAFTSGADGRLKVKYTPGGGVPALPYTDGANTNQIMVVKFDSSGNLQWQAGLGGLGTQGGGLNVRDVAVDDSGNVYATGKMQEDNTTSNHPYDVWVAKWNSSGTLQWKRQLGGRQQSSPSVMPPGETLHYSQGYQGNGIAVNGSTGDCYVACGHTWVVAKWNTDGVLQWQKRPSVPNSTYSKPGDMCAVSIAIDNVGNIYTTGMERQFHSASYAKVCSPLIKMDPSGNILWYINGEPSGWRDRLYGDYVKCDSQGNVITLAYGEESDEVTNNAVRVTKFDSSGNRLWKNRFGTTSWHDDFSGNLAIDSNDNVIFTTKNEKGPLIAKFPGDGSDPNSISAWSDTFSSDSSHPWYPTLGDWEEMQNIDYSENTRLTQLVTVSNPTMSATSLPEHAGVMAEVTLNGSITSYGPGNTDAYIYDSPGYGILSSVSPIYIETIQTKAAVSSFTGNTITLTNVQGTWENGMPLQSDVTYPGAVSATNILISSDPPALSQTSNPWPNDGSAQWQSAEWEIATDENFTQNVQTATSALSGTGTQGPNLTLEASTGYYLRVRYKALGNNSDWSSSVYFVTAA